MRMSNKSWHVRLCRIGASSYVPSNLCSHFWTVVGCLALWTIVCVIGLVLSPLIGIGVGIWWCNNKYLEKHPRIHKEPGLVGSYVAAKHRKGMPID